MYLYCVLCLNLRVEEELPQNQKAGVDRGTRRRSHHSLAVEVSSSSVFSLLIRHMISCHNLSYRQQVFTIILYIYCTCDFIGKKSEIVQSEQDDFNTFSLFGSKNQGVINAFRCVKSFLPHIHLRHIVARY